MSNVIQIRPNADIQTGLRAIADDIDKWNFKPSDCTVIIDTEVFHLGTADDDLSAQEAIFNMTYGIHKLMSSAAGGEEE